ncbi:MAG: superoxide dismutase family protein [Thermomicrobiales bacterium]
MHHVTVAQRIAGVLLATSFLAPGIAVHGQEATPAPPSATPVARGEPLIVPLIDASGNQVGEAGLQEEAGGVAVVVTLAGLPPGEHGWHLHAMGQCDPDLAEPFSTAGPHWDPTAMMHGGPESKEHHVGDFGNLTAGDDGMAEATITTETFTLGEGPTSVFDADGTAIVIHTGQDDLVSQPSGNSGARFACGVVAAPREIPATQGKPSKQTSAEGNVLAPSQMPLSDDLLSQLQAPDGFTIETVAQGLTNPRMMALGPDGTLYVTQPAANMVSALRDNDGDGVMEDVSAAASNLPFVHGILFQDNRVYLAGEKTIWLADVNADGTFSAPRVIVDDLPDGDQHGRHTLQFGPDGKLYVSVGSSCNACRETNPENATILRMNPDGSEREIFAAGLRNTIGWAWDPQSGALWGMDQGSDWRGDEQPPEELNRLREGANYGWPYCFADQQVDDYLPYPPPGATPDQYCANTEAPALTYEAHSSPIGMVFYDGAMFPAEYQGDALIAMRGSWNRAEPSGYKIVRLDFENGEPVGFEDFITGWLQRDGVTAFGRVAGLLVMPDGSLLISEDSNGVIYRVSYRA